MEVGVVVVRMLTTGDEMIVVDDEMDTIRQMDMKMRMDCLIYRVDNIRVKQKGANSIS